MYHKHFQTRKTSQGQVIPGREKDMVPNKAGGFGFQVDDWTRLHRFLVLGAEGGTYYASEQNLTIENAQAVLRCIQKNGPVVVEHVRQISSSGRAPKNDPALFVLAMCAGMGDPATKREALKALPDVARIGTHLFTFLEYVQAFRGWGRALRNAIAEWYNSKDPEKLAYQVVKYQQRGGWSNRDALRLAHPTPASETHNAIYRWVTQKERTAEVPQIINGFIEAQTAEHEEEVAAAIREYDLPREAVPTWALKSKKVWEALLDKGMPMTALIRNLGNMTKMDVLKPMSDYTKLVVEELKNEEKILRSRVHPLTILQALTTYSSGRGFRGSGAWTPITAITDALDSAFYTAFGNVEPTNKRLVFGIDVSASMGWDTIGGSCMTAAQAAGALALVTANVESQYQMMAFSHVFKPLNISPRMRLDSAMKVVQDRNFGRTDCALPMMWALNKKVEADAFVVITDNETWFGQIHPYQALNEYRRKSGIPAKLAVVAMTASDVSIADPNDAGMLDLVGWDTATPNVLSDFIRE